MRWICKDLPKGMSFRELFIRLVVASVKPQRFKQRKVTYEIHFRLEGEQ